MHRMLSSQRQREDIEGHGTPIIVPARWWGLRVRRMRLWRTCGLALTSSFVQRLGMTMYSDSVFCILYAMACSWLKLLPTLRLTLKLVPLKKMKMMMDMDMEER